LVQAECVAPHIANGCGKWVELSIGADPIYQTILIAAEKAFWRAVVAQWLDPAAHNDLVAGSSPAGPTVTGS
jgi:hypothetical protein